MNRFSFGVKNNPLTIINTISWSGAKKKQIRVINLTTIHTIGNVGQLYLNSITHLFSSVFKSNQ